VRQGLDESELVLESGRWPRFRTSSSEAAPTDTLLFDPAGALVGTRDQHSEHHFFAADAAGGCYSRTVRAVDGLVTEVTDGSDCL
jgi:hypothetical protein